MIVPIFATVTLIQMNILLLGSGGREHAFAWKICKSKHCSQLFIAPGNAGTAKCGTNLDFNGTDFELVANACVENRIDLVVVGPEEPLVKGIADFLYSNKQLPNILVLGPDKNSAQLEGSKAFAKEFMRRHDIPTASYKEFTAGNFEEGLDYLHKHELPIVLKADGLAAGKGVVICQNHVEAISEFELMIQRAKFGEAGKKVVVEKFLDGVELSVFVLTDGKSYTLLPEAKDYKKVGEGEKGLNTGGMGAISPVPFMDEDFKEKVISRVIEPTIAGLQKDELNYCGFIFFGLINVDNDPYVIEYNCRMGDPEAEAVVPRIKNDLVELFLATVKSELSSLTIDIDPRPSAVTVAVSGGYPNDFEKGFEIHGLSEPTEDKILFYSGTKNEGDKIVTTGGRVICATGLGNNLNQAVAKSQELASAISFEGKYFRRDIGFEFLDQES